MPESEDLSVWCDECDSELRVTAVGHDGMRIACDCSHCYIPMDGVRLRAPWSWCYDGRYGTRRFADR